MQFLLTHKGNLSIVKEDTLIDYQAISNFIASLKIDENYRGKTDSSILLSLQLQLYIKNYLHTFTNKMKLLFNLLEIKDKDTCVIFIKVDSITILSK